MVLFEGVVCMPFSGQGVIGCDFEVRQWVEGFGGRNLGCWYKNCGDTALGGQ